MTEKKESPMFVAGIVQEQMRDLSRMIQMIYDQQKKILEIVSLDHRIKLLKKELNELEEQKYNLQNKYGEEY